MAEVETGTSTRANGNGGVLNSWTNWPSVTGACRLLEISIGELNRLVREGVIESFKAPNGTLRFKQEWLDDYKHARDELPADKDEDNKDREAARVGIPAEAIKATAELLKAAQQQNLELHKLVIQGFKASHDAQAKTIDQLLSRQEKHEAVISALYAAREAYFDNQLERQLVVDSHKAAGERRTAMWNMSTQYLGELVQGVKKKWGLEDGPTAQFGAVAELLKTLNAEQIEVACMMGFFSEAQIALIEKIIGKPIPRTPPKNTPDPNAAAAEPPAAAASAGDAAPSATDSPAEAGVTTESPT